MISFPASADTFPSLSSSEFLGAAGTIGLAQLLTDLGDATEATEAKLGTGSSIASAGKVLRATGAGASAWGQIDVTTDVASFTSANLRTLLSDETGTGAAVFADTPTILTPTIASFTNAQHTHTNAAGGGQIPTAGLADASITARKMGRTWYAGEGAGGFMSGGAVITVATVSITLEVTSDIAVKGLGSGNTNSANGTLTPKIKRDGTTKKTGTTLQMNAADREAAFVIGYTETSLAAGTYSMTLTTEASGDADAGAGYMEILVKAT
jgi:hypothetical protein